MTILEDWLLKAKSAADTVGKKTVDMTEMVKLKTKAAGIQKEIDATLEGMGRLVYDSRKDGRDVSELLEDSAKRVDQLEAERKAIEDELCTYQKVVRCPQCDNKVDEGAAYCPQCGRKMQDD